VLGGYGTDALPSGAAETQETEIAPMMMPCRGLTGTMLVAVAVTFAMRADGQPSQSAQGGTKAKAGASTGPGVKVEPRLDPKAMDLLKAACARLAAAKTMSFTAVATYESPSRNGAPLVYTTLSQVTLQRPDKLKVITPGDGPASEFYYDGHTMMAYAPAENLVAVADAPPTIDAALKAAYDSAAIYFPFTDVLVSDPYKDLAEGLVLAYVVGQSHVVGGTTTDIVVIANPQVFAQIWIGAEDKLPHMVRALYASDPSMLRQQVEFSNWSLDGQIPADIFTSARASSAKRIEFARPYPQVPPGAAGPKGKAPPAKSSGKKQ
jgi:hypothetical protein